MKVGWTRLALTDLGSAYNYIAEESPSAAAQVVAMIEKAVEAIGRHPEIGRPGRVEATREFVVSGTPYVVAYRVRAQRVEVLAVIHGARRWPDQF